ncbi:immunoglobulin alpha Fc receptor [Ctenodactylus gundi]
MAVPGPIVPWNASVRILCRGTNSSFLYHLLLLGRSSYGIVDSILGFREEAEFVISHMNMITAGLYRCQYRQAYRWSELSKDLGLVVAGLYDQPLLSWDRGPEAGLGEQVSLQCLSAHTSFDRFSLAREGDASLLQKRQHQGRQVTFALGPVTPGLAGNYVCYAWNSSHPYVWSAPSNALELTVADSKVRDHTVENAVRMGAAGLVLLALLALVAEHGRSRGAPPQQAWQDKTGPTWSRGAHQTDRTYGPAPGGHK